MKLIYLASPYTPRTEEEKKIGHLIMMCREAQINQIGAYLQARYKIAIFPPITISAVYKRELPNKFGTTFDAWAEIDLCAIEHCDEVWVVLMKGWDKSVGVMAEIEFAKRKGIPVRLVNPKTKRLMKGKV